MRNIKRVSIFFEPVMYLQSLTKAINFKVIETISPRKRNLSDNRKFCTELRDAQKMSYETSSMRSNVTEASDIQWCLGA